LYSGLGKQGLNPFGSRFASQIGYHRKSVKNVASAQFSFLPFAFFSSFF